MNRNKLIVFSAPSGAGKTTLVKHILSQFSNTNFSISATSRSPRGSEKDGIDYHFLSNSEFKKKIENNEFIEFEEVYGGVHYWTLKSEVENIWANNEIALFDIDVVGGFNIKKMYPDNTLSIFVMPPSIEELENRLRSRKTESEDKIQQRISKANEELQDARHFDVVLENDNFDRAVEEAESIVQKFMDKWK